MATVDVLDSHGATVALEKPLAPGRAAAAASRPVAVDSETKAVIDTLATQATLANVLAKILTAPATEAKQDAAITQETAINTVLGVQADAASASTTIKAALRGIATALGITALDLGTGTGGSRTLRFFQDTAQFIGGAGSVNSATQRHTLASDDPAVATLGATADAVVVAGAAGSLSAKLRAISRDLVANIVLAAGTNLIGKVGIDQTTPGTTNAVVVSGPTATARLASSAASTNATNVKTSAGRIHQASGKNNAAYDVFMVLYDSAANPPVPNTTTIRKKLCCPAGQAFVYDFPAGVFASGIGYAFTKLVADADTTAIAAADITAFNLDYA